MLSLDEVKIVNISSSFLFILSSFVLSQGKSGKL